MTKDEVFEMLDNEPWQDGKGNHSRAEGAIQSIWGYNKKEAVSIHRVHYTHDPIFHFACGDTEPDLTRVLPYICPDAPMDDLNFEDFIWIGSCDIFKNKTHIETLMAQLP
jgi:hypothetical protein